MRFGLKDLLTPHTFRPVKSDSRDFSVVSYSDNQFRSKVVVYGATRYSLVVNADIKGDFLGGTGKDWDGFVFLFILRCHYHKQPV